MCQQDQAGVELPGECPFEHDKISGEGRVDSFPGVQF
jgi:hypothetical protein